MRELTDRPFVVNHVVPALDVGAFEATLPAGEIVTRMVAEAEAALAAAVSSLTG